MNTVTVSAAVSAIVTVLVGTALQWGRQISDRLRRWLTADHVPITVGSGWAATTVGTQTDQARLLLCCAPAKSLPRPTLDPDRAIAFVRSEFGDLFADEPVYSMPKAGVRFERPAGDNEDYLWVHTSGRVDLCLTVPTLGPDGARVVDVLGLVRPLLRLRRAVRSRGYAATLPGRRRGRWRRYDWTVALTPTVQFAGRGGVSWDALGFPGTPPPRAGSEQRAFCPADGYARDQLRSWRLTRPADRLVKVVLADLLAENGYHHTDDAIEQVLAVCAQDTVRSRAGFGPDALDGDARLPAQDGDSAGDRLEPATARRQAQVEGVAAAPGRGQQHREP